MADLSIFRVPWPFLVPSNCWLTDGVWWSRQTGKRTFNFCEFRNCLLQGVGGRNHANGVSVPTGWMQGGRVNCQPFCWCPFLQLSWYVHPEFNKLDFANLVPKIKSVLYLVLSLRSRDLLRGGADTSHSPMDSLRERCGSAVWRLPERGQGYFPESDYLLMGLLWNLTPTQTVTDRPRWFTIVLLCSWVWVLDILGIRPMGLHMYFLVPRLCPVPGWELFCSSSLGRESGWGQSVPGNHTQLWGSRFWPV